MLNICKIKNLMEEKGLNQEQLAKKANVDPSFISLVFRGKRQPSPDTLKGIAAGLGCTMDELVTEEGY